MDTQNGVGKFYHHSSAYIGTFLLYSHVLYKYIHLYYYHIYTNITYIYIYYVDVKTRII